MLQFFDSITTAIPHLSNLQPREERFFSILGLYLSFPCGKPSPRPYNSYRGDRLERKFDGDSITYSLATPEEQELTLDSYIMNDDGSLDLKYKQVWDPYSTDPSYRQEYDVYVKTVPNVNVDTMSEHPLACTITELRFEKSGESGSRGSQGDNQSSAGSGTQANNGDYILPGVVS